MSFDISTIEVSDTFDVEIKHPVTDDPMPGDEGRAMSVTVYGPGTKQFKAAQTVQSNRVTKRAGRRGKLETTPDEAAADKANFLSACTRSFNNFSYKDGDPSDRETFRACFLDPKMGWLTEQVNSEMGDWGNFTKGAPTT